MRFRLALLAALALLALGAPAAHAVTFANGPGSPHPARFAQKLATGDVNRDGHVDVVASGIGGLTTSSNLAVLLGDGRGGLRPSGQTPPAGRPVGEVAIGDLDGDGNPDLAATTNDGGLKGEVALLFGDGTGGFPRTARLRAPPPGFEDDIAVADLDGDGDLDIALLSARDEAVSVYLGDGSGKFAATGDTSPTGKAPTALVSGDIDNDGDLDLVVGNRGGFESSGFTVLVGDGTGRFASSPRTLTGLFGTLSLAASDFDGDGNLDLAVTGPLQVLRGDGRGAFAPVADRPVSNSGFIFGLAAGNVDGDGVPDLAYGTDGVVRVGLGDGDGTFTPNPSSLREPPGFGGAPLLLGDLDEDGRPDLIYPGDGGVRVALNGVVAGASLTACAPGTSGGVACFDVDEGGRKRFESTLPGECRASKASFDRLVIGTDADDRIVGTDGGDVVLGGLGDDRVDAGGGDDCVLGEDGNDIVFGNGGADRLLLSFGDDKARGGKDDDIVFGKEGDDRLRGDLGNDLVRGGGGDDKLGGGPGDDRLGGASNDDKLRGGDGADRLHAGNGDNVARGDRGDDLVVGGGRPDGEKLTGGPGDDRLKGKRGDDVLRGGSGRDRFRAGKGDDHVDARGQRSERVSCGKDTDTVRTRRREHDRIQRDCERVRR